MRINPRVADAIQWQFQPADVNNVYAPPTAADKAAWPAWTAAQRADLVAAYIDTCKWFAAGSPPVPIGAGGLSDTPVNANGNVANDTTTVGQSLAPDAMWTLYIAHVAFVLAVELRRRVPWSIAAYDDLALRYLFDSTTMAWNLRGTEYGFGTYAAFVPDLRADNRPKTAFAPPRWTWDFLDGAQLIGPTRRDSIGRVLDWMRANLWHFFGADTYGNCDAIWQYRGYPPLSRIVAGTVDAGNPTYGARHWTLGCHGSVGLLHQLLRVLGIPVQPVWVAGHELACFLTEGLYLDHGDDPYNLNVRNSTAPSLALLIDEATYMARFTNDLAANIVDVGHPALANVGRSAAQFPP